MGTTRIPLLIMHSEGSDSSVLSVLSAVEVELLT